MSGQTIRVLIIDDDEEDYILARDAFAQVRHASYLVEWAPDFEAGLAGIAEGRHDVYLLDYQLGPRTGMELLKEAVQKGCRKPMIMLTGHGDHEVDLVAMQSGAADYLDKKDLNPATLERATRYAIAHFQTLEELRAAKEEAEQATLMRDKYVALVSHDLRGPLTVIGGFLSIVRKGLPDSAGHEHADYLDRSIAVTKRMANVVNELLAIGRFKTGKINPHPRPVDVQRLIEEDLDIFASAALRKDISIVNSLPPGFTMLADPAMIGEVLYNLLSNAVKFTPPGGKVTVFAPEGKADTVAVADTGAGINPEFQNRLFLYEEKTTLPGTAGETGTGLGLPLAHDIIRAHNGALYFETGKGKGTTFYVSLPEK